MLVDKGNDKLTTYSNDSDKSTKNKTDHTNVSGTLHKLSNTNPIDSKNNHKGTANLDNSKPSKTIKYWLCSKEHRLMNCETSSSNYLPEKKAFFVK